MNHQNTFSFMKKTFILLALVFCWKTADAQIPNTHIYLFKMEQFGDSLFQFNNPQLLTAFNEKGYNNQPAFFSNDEIYFSMGDASGTIPTNIVSLNLRTKVKTEITLSADREYSPTPLIEPYYFSCVRQEADGKDTQRLWVFPIDRSSKGQPILPKTTGVGYHCWLGNEIVALFIVGDPVKLAIANTKDKTVQTITSNIGRCLQRMENGNLAYIHKTSESNWTIKELDLETMRSTTIVSTVPQSEDFVILPKNTFVMASGSKLYKYQKGWDIGWLEIGDFSKLGLKNITRMAVSNDGKIALVDVK